jgi:hypothetical protein
MYRQGLGDCFLLTFPRAEGEAHVLIDCGVLTGTKDAATRMRAVARNIVDTTNRRLDVLVVSHEHWDHISGFLQAEEIFDRLRIDEVWLAWTENPKDDLANELRNRKVRALRGVEVAIRQLRGMAHFGAGRTADRLTALLEFEGGLGAQARKTTARAMEWVKSRDGAVMRYGKPGDEPFMVPGVDGARVYVLGPPRNRKLLKRSDPSKKSSEVYELGAGFAADLGFLSALESLDGGGGTGAQPFDRWFRLSGAEIGNETLFAEHYWTDREEWRRIEHDWMEAAGRLALNLDSDTNNTCLALAFELGKSGGVLLFPGDAQVGNWLSWEGLEWKAGDGPEARTVTSRDLLARTVLYKVGHHGSHNATLREKGLELMTSDDLAVMIPVSRLMAEKMEWRMPFPSLLRRLEEKTGGRILDLDHGVPAENPGLLSPQEWQRFVTRTDVQADWMDYRLPW